MKRYFIPLITAFLMGPALVHGQSDLVEIMTPNAMIIFDTSSSMNKAIDGSSINAHEACVDAEGNLQQTNQGHPVGGKCDAGYTPYLFEGGTFAGNDVGGNHPDSKLYQAKLALKKVIKDLLDINLGFSTYAQFKAPQMMGRYIRDRWDCTGGQTALPPTCTWEKLYWRWNNTYHGPYTSTSTLPLGNFKDVWGYNQTGLTSVGSILYERNHTFDDKTVSPSGYIVPPTYKADLEYHITGISFNAELNIYTYTYQSIHHDHYNEQYLSIGKTPGCAPDPDCTVCKSSDCTSSLINCTTPWPTGDFKNPWGAWKTFFPGDGGYSPKWRCSNPTFTCQKAIECQWSTQKQEKQFQAGGATSCVDTLANTAYNYPAMDKAKGSSWTNWKYLDNCYDSSSFTYPSYGSTGNTNKPDTWSYFKIDTKGATDTNRWIWPIDQTGMMAKTPLYKDSQPAPFYPARDDKGIINDRPGTFDNHYFFINIPKADDSTNDYPNKKAILASLDLTPVQNPQTGNYWTKLPLKPDSLTSNTSETPVNQTPIADSLYMAKRYFDDYMKQDAPSKVKCRGNNIILLTDGLESCRFKDPYTNLQPDFKLGKTAAKDLYDAGVKTFVIGFGKDVGANVGSLNEIALAGSDAKCPAFFTDTLQGLTDAIKTIFQIISGSYSRSSPVVSSTRNRIFRGYFNLPGYEGHLAAYDLNADGTVKTPETWDAGKVMNSNGRGPTQTWVEGNFGKSKGDLTNVDLTDKKGKKLADYLNPLGEDINVDGKADKKDAQTVVSFTLNPNYDDGKNGPGFYKGARSGKWLLGDIYHSTPLVVGPPNFNFPDIAAFSQKYSEFKKMSRETMIYVGANDGMLHAFSEKDGKEKFGIVPNNLLGKLKDLRTSSHQFFVDSSPRAHDVFMGGSWSTVLISGERAGGNGYFALDVTDPKDGNYPGVLWEMTDAGMGNTWSRPEIGWVRISGQEKFVAFVGGGYSANDDVGNTFYVIDIADGSILRKFVVGGSKNKIPAGATAFDSDLDGRVNGVYFGDINGVLWKIKIDKEEDKDKWELRQLYTPATNSPVFYPPAVTKNNQGKILVYYGQGNELDIFKADNNSFFEIWDKGDSGVKIWEEPLEPGEKALAAPAVANNVVYFTTWKYTGDMTDCGAGKGRLWGLTITSAAGPGDQGALILDPTTGSDLGAKKKYFDITDHFPESRGIPSVPIVTNGIIYLSTSLNANQLGAFRIPTWGGRMRLKKWRELF
jgi:hypothetical protein